MSLKSWLVRRRLLAELQVWKVKVDAERQKLDSVTGEGRMPTWLHTVAVIFAGGAISALADALMAGSSMDAAGLKRAGIAGLVGGLIAVAAWLKQSPIKPKDAAPLLLCLFAGSASADILDVSAPNWGIVHVAAWAVLLGVGGMFATLMLEVWRRRPQRGFGFSLGITLTGCLLLLSAGCGLKGQVELNPQRPKGIDQGVVENLVCHGEIKEAETYAQDRQASRAEVTEAIQRAMEKTAHRPGCCAGPTCPAAK